MSDDESEEVSLCDYCGTEMPADEVGDCQPDDTGYCIRCGANLTGTK